MNNLNRKITRVFFFYLSILVKKRSIFMKTKLLGAALALGLAVTPLASIAGGVGGGNANSNWTIYGWQNYSWNFVDNGVREFDTINSNAANIGFAANIDTGVSVGGQAVKVNLQCEQFTYHQRNTSAGWCNRNSKLGLSGVWGEIMFAQWLLPFNEMVAQWVDPFYDAGATSHTSIMGNIGFAPGGGNFYNGGIFPVNNPSGSFDFYYDGAYSQAFNRRQEGIIQWMSPNWNGLNARFAITEGRLDETAVGTEEIDPQIMSMGISYTTDLGSGTNLWGAVTYEEHDDWGAAAQGGTCDGSDDEAYRIAARMIHDFGGFGLTLSAMYEELEYETDNCAATTIYTDTERESWMVSGKLDFAGPLDLRFSYMNADDLDCGNGNCGAQTNNTDNDTAAEAYNIGLFYTMPAGTELRIVYSDVDNDDNAQYDFGITGHGSGVNGEDLDMIEIGVVQWF